MTPDATRALQRAGFSRRSFLKGSGALIVSFTAGATLQLGSRPSGAQTHEIDPDRLESWIAIAADGSVRAYTGKCELGQGLYTAQIQLIAEELDVPIERVHLMQCDTSMTPDQGTTSGSQSHPENFNHTHLAQAAATAREALLRLASERLGAQPEQLKIADGIVSVASDATRSIGYGALVEGRALEMPLSTSARRKRSAEWTVLGRSVPRVDLPALAAGSFEFVHNIRVPDMLHGSVVRPPGPGARLEGVDESSVRQLPGLVDIVVERDFVGVVAEKPWQAMQASRRLKTSWTSGSPLPSQRDLYENLRSQRPVRDTLVVDSGDVEARLGEAAATVEATYLHPYQMHGSLASSCAVADVRSDRATIWSSTQAVHPLKRTTAMLLSLPLENVRVVYVRGSGCYGINGADTVSYDAALLSRAVGKPVRVQLTRRDEMAWENFGNAFVVDQRVGVDDGGNIVGWDCETWSPGRGGRPGRDAPGNVVTGWLAGFEPRAFRPRTPAPDPSGPLRNRSNAAPPYVAGCVDGRCGGSGTVRSERVLSHRVESVFFTGPLRAPARLQNTFAHECLIDEVAARVKADPVEYRVRHLTDARLIEVVTTAAKAARWRTRPSPLQGSSRIGVVSGRGVACVRYKGVSSYAALVAEVDVDQATGEVEATRFVMAHDCGPISNPNGLENQIEGGALQGLSRALGEEVTWDEQRVTSVDWGRYGSLSLGFAMPAIECVLIDRPDGEALGAGETSITVVAAALGNAIFDATGVRVRQLPFTPDRVKAALDARA